VHGVDAARRYESADGSGDEPRGDVATNGIGRAFSAACALRRLPR
jgi:hypothetical protein